MKRLLILVLALTLCFAGCKEEPKMPDTPEVEHTEEVKAPVEETPTEPEVIEPTEEPDENVIILPEPDENTKVITIEFPEDFPEEPYTEPELVSPEEFEWGDCSFTVEYAPIIREWYECYPQKAILREGIYSLEEGTAEYNNHHGIKTQPQVNIWDSETLTDETYYITHNSQNALSRQVANNKGLLFFYISKNENFDVWYAFSNEENRIVYEFLLQSHDWTSMEITQLTDRDKLVLSLYKQNNNNMGFRCVSAYTYSIEKQKLCYIKSFAYDPIMSEDEKYLAYTSPHLDAWDMITTTNNLNKMQTGFYIEEIKTGKTVFYPVTNSYNIIIE